MRFILQLWSIIKIRFVNWAKPRSWWIDIEYPIPKATLENLIEIKGWAFNPFAEIERMEVVIEDRVYGRLKVGELRSDIYGRFRLQHSKFSGFSGNVRYITTINRDIEIILRILDDTHEIVETSVNVTITSPMIEADAPKERSANPRLMRSIKEIITQYQVRYGRHPKILDWSSSLALQQILSNLSVIRTTDSPLYYPPSSFDAVFLGQENLRKSDDARRIARDLVVGVLEHDDKLDVQPRWLTESDLFDASQVTVIISASEIPELLEQLFESLQQYELKEIIIIKSVELQVNAAIKDRPQVKIIYDSPETSRVVLANRAGLSAQGEVLVFIEGDLAPVDDWLSPLLFALNTNLDHGVIGSQILDRDRRIYDAGGVIFKDGSYYGYGHSDTLVNSPLYTTSRFVDVIASGVFATPRSLFVKLGGFNASFQPGRYEYIDYCIRIRDELKKTYYCSDSVMRLDAVRVNDDTGDRLLFSTQKKEYLQTKVVKPQQLDHRALYSLWNPVKEHKRVILCCDSYDIDQNLHFEMLRRAFIENGWAVSILAQQPIHYPIDNTLIFVDNNDQPYTVEEIITNGQFHLAIFENWKISQKYAERFRLLSHTTKRILDVFELDFVKVTQKTANMQFTLEYGEQLVQELNQIGTVDKVFLVHEHQQKLLEQFNIELNNPTLMVPFADFSVSELAYSQREGVVFLGDFSESVHEEGISFFMRHVLPIVPSRVKKDQRYYVVGQNATAMKKYFHAEHKVITLEKVPSLSMVLQKARVVLLPIFSDDWQALACLIKASLAGTPTIATPEIANRLGFQHETNVFMAYNTETFSQFLERLLMDEGVWIRVAAYAYEFALEHYHYDVFRFELKQILDNLFND